MTEMFSYLFSGIDFNFRIRQEASTIRFSLQGLVFDVKNPQLMNYSYFCFSKR
jgi:hypothetical protein